jgi:hypothetical protein
MSDTLPTPPELEPIVAELDRFSRQLRWICLNPVETPTTEQLKAVQTFFPLENLLSVRRRLVEGTARVGPFIPNNIEAFCQVAFAPNGLTWHVESPNEADLISMGVESHA